MVFQENSLVPTMTVAQNLFLGQEQLLQPPARHQHRRAAVPAIAELRRRPPRHIVGTLGAAKKQMVEIARAVLHNAKVIIFDEPTAALTPEEKKYFFDLVRDLKQARRLDRLHLAMRWKRR